MNWHPASFAALIRLCKSGVRACFHRFRSIYGGGSDTAQITSQKPKPSLPPQLVLTQAMQRDALIVDRNKAAKMLDMQAVHRLESDLRKLTNRILTKGVCSNAKHG